MTAYEWREQRLRQSISPSRSPIGSGMTELSSEFPEVPFTQVPEGRASIYNPSRSATTNRCFVASSNEKARSKSTESPML